VTLRIATLAAAVAVLASCAPQAQAPCAQPGPPLSPLDSLLPLPAKVERRAGDPFTVSQETTLVASDEAASAAAMLRRLIRQATGFEPKLLGAPDGAPAKGVISLTIDPGAPPGDEAYDLTVAADRITIRARKPAGLFYGAQTLRQLLPPHAEHEAIVFTKPAPATIPAAHVADAPRYAWRGAMLDVARHFFGVDEVKRFVDLLALHKMNRLHLHLTDDQGWRIEIQSWPDLTRRGGTTQVGFAPSGEGSGRVLAYTQREYADLVRYAADRFVTIVPEIDMPGHMNAALHAYAELGCDGVARKPYTGTENARSTICVDGEVAIKLVGDVVREIAAITPGVYFHIGGDEVKTLTPEQYRRFVERVQAIVGAHGKRMIGWDEIAEAKLDASTIVHHWRPDASKQLLAASPHLILSPADRAYLDMKYDESTPLGLDWAGLVPVERAYDWDPDAAVPGARAGSVLGVEAPLWSETTATMRDVEHLAMPRLAEIAEVSWTPQAHRRWETFKVRLGAQAPRWTAMGINFYRAPEVPWRLSRTRGG
jgi:hexosaminidase